VNAYIATEAGMIAIECPLSRHLHVQEDRVHLEILLDSGEVANEGTGELLVTNLVNWCSVFIRYCIGDRGTLVHERCRCGFEGATLTDLPGKEARTFPLARGSVESAAFERLFASLPIKQYQVAQRTDGGLHVSWIAAPNDEPNPAAVQRAVRTLLPADVPCEITQVTRINVRAAKQRRFIRPPGPTLHQPK
jgi:phenylacetate-CoA ligase